MAVKHYLRGEEGIEYEDLYHFVKFLPSYVFPAGIIPPGESTVGSEHISSRTQLNGGAHFANDDVDDFRNGVEPQSHGDDVEAQTTGRKCAFPTPLNGSGSHTNYRSTLSGRALRTRGKLGGTKFEHEEDIVLLPASMPPKFSVYNVFPISLATKLTGRNGAAAERNKGHQSYPAITTENVPLEIATYLVRRVRYFIVLE